MITLQCSLCHFHRGLDQQLVLEYFFFRALPVTIYRRERKEDEGKVMCFARHWRGLKNDFIYIHTRTHTYIYMHVCICAHTYISRSICLYLYLYILDIRSSLGLFGKVDLTEKSILRLMRSTEWTELLCRKTSRGFLYGPRTFQTEFVLGK